jgi:hypothetical protein
MDDAQGSYIHGDEIKGLNINLGNVVSLVDTKAR